MRRNIALVCICSILILALLPTVVIGSWLQPRVCESLASCSVAVTAGEMLSFSCADLERRLNLAAGELGGITVTELPAPAQGVLFLDDTPVKAFDFLTRTEVDRLCFEPLQTAGAVSFTFLPQSRQAVSTSLHIEIIDRVNNPPTIEDLSVETVQNVPRSGVISCSDPDSDPLTLQVLELPRKGSVTFDGFSFLYRPYRDMTGNDKFTVCAVDSAGAYSRTAVVHIRIEKERSTPTFVDMQQHPSAYAAIQLREKGILTGEQVGDAYFFSPDHEVERGEFLIMLISAAGLEETLLPTVNTGLPNDAELPAWLKPYVRAGIASGILLPDQPFAFWEIPTRAEAVVLTDRAAAIYDVKDYALSLPDQEEIPDWALASYKDLSAYRMLDLPDGYARPQEALDRAGAADLLWQLYRHTHR